jgi:drug/metabolite transporter (DMT)-like permease
MEKQLSALGYWLGLICTVLALIFRMFTALNISLPRMGAPGGPAISYLSFFHGAALFFLLAIASWCRTAKSY